MAGFAAPDQVFTYAEHGFEATAYSIPTDQYGTQLDPPSHWNEYGATIDELPPTFSLRPLVVIDLHEKVAVEPQYAATVADILAWEAKHHTTIPAGAVVFFRTDWSRDWPDVNAAVFPAVSLAALQFLHGERRILLHGHEWPWL